MVFVCSPNDVESGNPVPTSVITCPPWSLTVFGDTEVIVGSMLTAVKPVYLTFPVALKITTGI